MDKADAENNPVDPHACEADTEPLQGMPPQFVPTLKENTMAEATSDMPALCTTGGGSREGEDDGVLLGGTDPLGMRDEDADVLGDNDREEDTVRERDGVRVTEREEGTEAVLEAEDVDE
jgi:hypothetical protein